METDLLLAKGMDPRSVAAGVMNDPPPLATAGRHLWRLIGNFVGEKLVVVLVESYFIHGIGPPRDLNPHL